MKGAGNKYIAHVKQNHDGEWEQPQLLIDHLQGTAKKAAKFARTFNSGEWAKAASFLHDAGKAPDTWQKYLFRKSGFDLEAHLEGNPGKVEHSIQGAKLAEELFGKTVGRFLAYCIAGHHAGLPDYYSDEIEPKASLSYRLSRADTSEIPLHLKKILSAYKPSTPPWKFGGGLDLSLWIRMLYSCLVDADFLDTEEYMQPDRGLKRGMYANVPTLLERFNKYMIDLTSHAKPTYVNKLRQNILCECREAARKEKGLFSLTVPTGGGKTLSCLAFALEHAVFHDLNKVIYVIPYTSIIEQTADVFKLALGTDQVVEHHSNLDENESTAASRLTAENWDAPVIVTTTVQFFESLFAAKPGRCRKLHNIANSVIVLDEAQLFPTEFLSPVLNALELLVEKYSVSIIISTATQPAFESKDGFTGIKRGSIREIITDVPALFDALKRVQIKVPDDWEKHAEWKGLAEELGREKQVLCVVSDRISCRELYAAMPEDDNTYHLSALMCGQHRSDIIAEIKTRLKEEKPVKVISTQLVEAGVDFDFPVVYRALAGLDAIAQAAGRCNREGKLSTGRVIVFLPPRKPPQGILRKAAETTEIMLKTGLQDILGHENFCNFFGELYWKANSLDSKDILHLLKPDHYECAIQFRTAASKFRIIDDSNQKSVIVPYGKGAKLIELLKAHGPERYLLRKLQRYIVNIYENEFTEMNRKGAVMEVYPGIFTLATPLDYDGNMGLKTDSSPYDAGSLVI